MGCLIALLAVLSPRLALVFVWLFTTLVDRAFDSFVVPLLGLLLLPWTTLLYVLCYQPVVGVSGWGWLWVSIGFLIDLSSLFGGAYGNRGRLRRR